MKQKFTSISVSETLKNKIDSRMRSMGLKTYTEVLEHFLEQNKRYESYDKSLSLDDNEDEDWFQKILYLEF